MHRSLHEVILPHEDSVAVYPTHGAGLALLDRHRVDARGRPSASSGATTGCSRRWTSMRFARALLAGQPAFPRYFARMRPTNQAGPSLLGGRRPAAAAARGRRRAGRDRPRRRCSLDLRTAAGARGWRTSPARSRSRPGRRSGRGSAGSCPSRTARSCSSFEARPTGTMRSARRCAIGFESIAGLRPRRLPGLGRGRACRPRSAAVLAARRAGRRARTGRAGRARS